MSGEAVPAIARTEIFLRSRKASRLLAGAAAQHGATAIMLLGAGLDGLDTGRGPRWLALASIVVGVVLAIVVVREIRALRRHGVEPDSPPIVDYLAVPLLVLEGVHKHEQGLHLIPWAYGLLALATLARALAWRRLVRIRRLRLDVAGIDIRLWPFRRTRVAWSAIAAITRVPAGLRVELRDGSERVLRLGDLDNRADVEAAILGAAAVGLLPDPESPLAS